MIVYCIVRTTLRHMKKKDWYNQLFNGRFSLSIYFRNLSLSVAYIHIFSHFNIFHELITGYMPDKLP